MQDLKLITAQLEAIKSKAGKGIYWSLFLSLFACGAFFIMSCSPTGKYQALAKKKLGKGGTIDYVKNLDSTLVLCKKESEVTPKNPLKRVSYFVYDLEKGKTFAEGKVVGGYVKWHDAAHLEVFKPHGNPSRQQSNQEQVFLIDIYTGEKTPKLNLEK